MPDQTLDELTPLDWAVNVLLASPQMTALIGDRIDEEDNVPPMEPGVLASDYFPRVIYSGTPHGTTWASALLLGWGDFTFKVLMREDALPSSADSLKSYTAWIARVLEAALTGDADPSAAGADLDGTERTVHGCEATDFHAPPLYGVGGQRICERGRVLRLVWS